MSVSVDAHRITLLTFVILSILIIFQSVSSVYEQLHLIEEVNAQTTLLVSVFLTAIPLLLSLIMIKISFGYIRLNDIIVFSAHRNEDILQTLQNPEDYDETRKIK